jgi:LacI family transcriptional regulator
MRRALQKFRRSGGSTSLVGQPLLGVNTVVTAKHSGAAALAHSLHDRGYRRFAVLAGPLDHLTARDRCASFSEALEKLGCPAAADAVTSTASTRDGKHQGMRLLLRDSAPWRSSSRSTT